MRRRPPARKRGGGGPSASEMDAEVCRLVEAFLKPDNSVAGRVAARRIREIANAGGILDWFLGEMRKALLGRARRDFMDVLGAFLQQKVES